MKKQIFGNHAREHGVFTVALSRLVLQTCRMMPTVIILYFLVAIVYLVATVHYAVEFVRSSERIVVWDRIERTITFVLHGLFLVALGYAYREIPLVRHSFFSFTALGLAIVHTILEGRYRTRGTGVFFFFLAFLLHLMSWPGVLHRPAPNELLQNPVYGLHAVAVLVGYVGFLISALHGVFFLLVYRWLKTRRLNLFVQRMPPLELLARMNFASAAVGFLFLTIGLLLGVILSFKLQVSFAGDPKVMQSMIVWLFYGLLILARYVAHWRGRLLVGASLVCFMVAVVSMAFVGFHDFPEAQVVTESARASS